MPLQLSKRRKERASLKVRLEIPFRGDWLLAPASLSAVETPSRVATNAPTGKVIRIAATIIAML